jgi:ornithine carbamoyltransferase
VPVINGLTKRTHPCQIMADVMTFEEHRGRIAGRSVAWTGDSNNVLASWVHARREVRLRAAHRDAGRTGAAAGAVDAARAGRRPSVVTDDPFEAVKGTDCVVTDCWVSMGDDDGDRHNLLSAYQVNERLMAEADPDALFMHCLPAHRGEEVTSEVMDGPAPWCSTRRKTGCMRKRAFSPGVSAP